MHKTFKAIPNAIPSIGFLNNSDEKSSIDCSKNPLGIFSLKGGRLYFIKYKIINFLLNI